MSSDLFAGLSLNPAASPAKSFSSRNGEDRKHENDSGSGGGGGSGGGTSIPASNGHIARMGSESAATNTSTLGNAVNATTDTNTKTDDNFDEFLGNFASGASKPASAPASASASAPTPPPESPKRLTSAPATDKLLQALGTPPSSPNGVASSSNSNPVPTSEEVATATATATSPTFKNERHQAKTPIPTVKPSSKQEDAAEVLTAFSTDSQRSATIRSNTNDKTTSQEEQQQQQKQTPPSSTERKKNATAIKPSLRGVGKCTQEEVPQAQVALRIFQKFASKVQESIPESHGGTRRQSIFGYFFNSTSVYDDKYDAYKSWSEAMKMTKTTKQISPLQQEDLDDSTESNIPQAIACFAHLCGVWGHASAHMAEVDSKTSQEYRQFCSNLSSALDTATALVSHGCLDGVSLQFSESSSTATNHNREGSDSSSKDSKNKLVINTICEAVFASDLSNEMVELSAMKFLLSTGCRVYHDEKNHGHRQAMLRKSHLLQSIRVLYHVYLTTESNANKTTARASLQQLVTSVFVRMITSTSNPDNNASTATTTETETSNTTSKIDSFTDGLDEEEKEFPTEDHRDAFLVLRSICKLSMRNPPSNLHSHIGLQASNSSTTWDATQNSQLVGGSPLSPKKVDGSSSRPGPTPLSSRAATTKLETPHLIFTQAIHPALESKILALDLLLYVLQNTDMKGDFFLKHSGTQFHYAIRHYLCVSLLKNCTSDDTRVVSLSLRVFVPIIRNFRAILKTEIEAFVTNVFFVILDSKNSPMEHKHLVVTLFEEICSDPQTLAEIFLNYDCDLSAIDLFHRIVNTLAKVARSMENLTESSTTSSLLGTGASRMQKERSAHRQVRLEAMRALRQVLASLHGSIVKPMTEDESAILKTEAVDQSNPESDSSEPAEKKQSLVEIYGSKKKRREEESEISLRFNQKPSAGLAYAAKCGHVEGSDPDSVAKYLLANKDVFDKTQIGEYLGREPDYQQGFAVKVLHGYVNAMDFEGRVFDDAIRYYLSGFRLPGEAQKIDRIMEKFAERFTEQNPDVFPTADVAFILAFSIIMLNTDLHNPAIKEERRMTKDGFLRNNRGICDGQDLPAEMLIDIFDRIKSNPISLKEDDEAREKAGEGSDATSLPSAISPAAFFASYEEADRAKESNFSKERDQIVRTTESLLRRKRHSNVSESTSSVRRPRSNSISSRQHHLKYVRTADSGLRDEYVSPMFEVTWGPALAAFSTAMESANGTVGALLSIASDDELEAAAMNAAETIEVCLAGFRFAICTAGLCGNHVARDAYMLALSRFSQLGTGTLLEPRHVRCVQTILVLARYDGELLGSSWEHAFRALSEINRFHQLFQVLARNDKAIAQAAERRRTRLQEREQRIRERQARRAARENSESLDDGSTVSHGDSLGDMSYYDDSDLFSESSDQEFREDMNTKEIDEANARTIYEAVSEGVIEAIYERSSSSSTATVQEFVHQLCKVSQMEIAGNWQSGTDLTEVQYREHHSLLGDAEGFHHHQTNIYSLQKLVEVTHYNMDSRPRLVFADIWTPVSEHLTKTALHSNPAVAMYALDSFRQLSIQFLQREELGAFEFQRRFLKPLETVMKESKEHTTKELLLKCVERLILMFGNPSQDDGRRGMLRSGWRPVLTVLGLAGRDPDAAIAKLGFGLLAAQLEPIIRKKNEKVSSDAVSGVLLDERFVDLVDALLVYVEGPHEDMSLMSIDHLFDLSSFLADESFAFPLIKKRGFSKSASFDDNANTDGPANDELELWWPVLLALSTAIGDERKNVRRKSLETLSKIITSYFFPKDTSKVDQRYDKQIQLLQLVFRGILMPVLEFAEVEVSGIKTPPLPIDFDRFLTVSREGEKTVQKVEYSWLNTTFDQFMDACINISLQAGEVFGDDTLLEEIFAMFNSCMLSDSGALAVRGLRRLEQFLSGDLNLNRIDDDTWATVSHMLRRCLTVRSLPSPQSLDDIQNDEGAQEATDSLSGRYGDTLQEFILEDKMLKNRRYVGGNAVMVIRSIMGSERFKDSLGSRWRLFLVSGVGKAINDWETAGELLETKARISVEDAPSYFETTVYGRKAMNRFLLQLAAAETVSKKAEEGTREFSIQALVVEQSLGLVSAYLTKEQLVTAQKTSSLNNKLLEQLTDLIRDMCAGYEMIPSNQLVEMSWLESALAPCLSTHNQSIKVMIQNLLTKLHFEDEAGSEENPPSIAREIDGNSAPSPSTENGEALSE